MRYVAIITALAGLVFAGCAQTIETKKFERKMAKPLEYKVAVAPITVAVPGVTTRDTGPEPTVEPETPTGAKPEEKTAEAPVPVAKNQYSWDVSISTDDLQDQIIEEMRKNFLWSDVMKLAPEAGGTKRNRKELLEDALKFDADVLLSLEIKSFNIQFDKFEGWWSNFLLWSFTWVPSWYVRDERYNAEIICEATLTSVVSKQKLASNLFKVPLTVTLDDFERGWIYWGIVRVPGALKESNWKKVEQILVTPVVENFVVELLEYVSTDFAQFTGTEEFESLMRPALTSSPPVIAIAKPEDGFYTEMDRADFRVVVDDDWGVKSIEVLVNGRTEKRWNIEREARGRAITEKKGAKKTQKIATVLDLIQGENTITVIAKDVEKFQSVKTITVRRRQEKRNIYACVIGIDSYKHNIPKLNYAVKDAKAFAGYCREYLKLSGGNLIELYNEQATLRNIRTALGTTLRNKATRNDTVLIYFAGHGAPETDSMNRDGDGLEKYLLPYDAEPGKLFAYALPMNEVSIIFSRLLADRVVFITDACYSGASRAGGDIFSTSGKRATELSDKFLERISSGRGRVVITAAGANQTSQEKKSLGHGVFTYYLLKGLKGEADSDGDKLVSTEEIYQYLAKQIPTATGQQQTPVYKSRYVEKKVYLGTTVPGGNMDPDFKE
ncbi:MAG: caspase family protein [Planctomycetota bacterium]|jgi:hypothetical protein